MPITVLDNAFIYVTVDVKLIKEFDISLSWNDSDTTTLYANRFSSSTTTTTLSSEFGQPAQEVLSDPPTNILRQLTKMTIANNNAVTPNPDGSSKDSAVVFVQYALIQQPGDPQLADRVLNVNTDLSPSGQLQFPGAGRVGTLLQPGDKLVYGSPNEWQKIKRIVVPINNPPVPDPPGPAVIPPVRLQVAFNGVPNSVMYLDANGIQQADGILDFDFVNKLFRVRTGNAGRSPLIECESDTFTINSTNPLPVFQAYDNTLSFFRLGALTGPMATFNAIGGPVPAEYNGTVQDMLNNLISDHNTLRAWMRFIGLQL